MLQRTFSRRLMAALLAPWLAVTLTVPDAVHSCALHSPAAGAATSPSPHAEHNPHAAHMAATSHEATPAATPAATADAPATSTHHGDGCTCPEGCCTIATVRADTPVTLAWIPDAVHREQPVLDLESAVALSTDHVLPFANGPPTVV
jgi:hypothetical protein